MTVSSTQDARSEPESNLAPKLKALSNVLLLSIARGFLEDLETSQWDGIGGQYVSRVFGHHVTFNPLS